MRAPLALLVWLMPALAAAQPLDVAWTEITPPYTLTTNSHFGTDLSWDGERLAIRSDGRVDVYTFDGVAAHFESELMPSGGPVEGFPGAIWIDHGRVLTSANGTPPDWSVYEFQLLGATWTQVAHLGNPASAPGDGSLVAVVVEGDRWVVSQPYINSNRGSVDLVRATGTGPFEWTTMNRSVVLGPTFDELTGHVLALRGADLLVGVIEGHVGGVQAGRVILYHDDGSSLSQVVSIDNPAPSYLDQFGAGCALDDQFLYVGARYEDATAHDAGVLYVYDRAGTSLQTISGTVPNGAYGTRITVDGDWMAVGAPTTLDVPGIGHLYLLQRDASGTWNERADVLDLASTVGGGFPGNVLLRGHTLVVSSSADVGGAQRAGRVWIGHFSEPDGGACAVDDDCTNHDCLENVCGGPTDGGVGPGMPRLPFSCACRASAGGGGRSAWVVLGLLALALRFRRR